MSVDQFLLSADTTDLNYPEIRPTLDLNFARVKALDPRITFTRSSGGSYVGADGLIKYAGVNEARFDHDPSTGESLGLLIEEARTNLLLRSEEFDSGTWGKTRISVTANAIEAPDGTLTADELIEDSSPNTTHFVNQNIPLTSGLDFVVSVYFKATKSPRPINLRFNTGVPTGNTTFDPTDGTFSRSSAILDATSVNVGNGWWRYSFRQVANATVNAQLQFFFSDSGISYTGDGTSGIYVWGAQLEQGAFPTSYIPTQASTRTRAADNAQITGKNFSEWYRQDEGTIFSKFGSMVPTPSNVIFIWSLFQDSTNYLATRTATGYTPNRLTVLSRVNNSNVFTSEITNTPGYLNMPISVVKGAFAFKKTNFGVSWNGGTVFGSNTGSLPSPTSLIIGSFQGVSSQLNGRISRLTYFPKRLPNAQLQALTR
jgi:hypothetical protein